MNKKVLVISSSPRKGGNSDVLCDQFIKGAKDAGNTAEKIFLKEWKINFCTGCAVCYETHKCPQHDDMEKLLAKLLESDVIVLATPVYFYSMCAQLKVMIDRICPRYTEITNKKMYLIATAGDTSKKALDGTIAGFRGFLDCLDDVEESGILYGTGVLNIGEIQNLPIMNEAYEMGKNV